MYNDNDDNTIITLIKMFSSN